MSGWVSTGRGSAWTEGVDKVGEDDCTALVIRNDQNHDGLTIRITHRRDLGCTLTSSMNPYGLAIEGRRLRVWSRIAGIFENLGGGVPVEGRL